MRQVSIRTLRKELSTQLQDLPFEITKNGKIIGIMCTQEDYIGDKVRKATSITKRSYEGKTTSTTDGTQTWINPLTNSALAPKE